jgi:hypothetical protein
MVATGLVAWAAGGVEAGIIVHTDDFIPTASVTGFNGFEQIPIGADGIHYAGGDGPYSEGGITVQQVNGKGQDSIWVPFFHPQGSYGWYPDGGDSGYTKITNTLGGDFSSVEMQVGTGFGSGADLVLYELLEGGNVVLTGSIPGQGNDVAHFLGFSGGGFDTILIRDESGQPGATVTGGGLNALAVDAIEVAAVPEPSAFVLVATAAPFGLGYAWRRRRRAA